MSPNPLKRRLTYTYGSHNSAKRRKLSSGLTTPVEPLAHPNLGQGFGSGTPSSSSQRSSFENHVSRTQVPPPVSQIAVNASNRRKARNQYHPSDNEIVENDSLVVISEDPPLTQDDTIPVRRLNNFAIYHKETKEFVKITELVGPRSSPSFSKYRASGIVTPWVDDQSDLDDDSEVEEETQSVQLSPILELNMYHMVKKKLDRKLYLETKYGWYVLEVPLPAYAPYFDEFGLKHKFTCLVLAKSLEDPKIDKAKFLEFLDERLNATPGELERLLAALDDDDTRAHLQGVLLEFPLNLSQVPIVRELFGELEYETRSTDDESHDEDSEIDADTDSNGDERTVASASTNGVLQPELLARPARPPTKITGRKTTVTRSVFQVCRRIFPVEQHKRFEFCDHSVRIPPVKRYPEREEHGAEPTCIWQTKPDVGGYYTSVLIDSTIYNVGDVVVVEPGKDADRSRAQNAQETFSKSINPIANQKWFAIISYMYEKGDEKYFHGQWLQPGSKTILQEAAHPSMLFTMLECENEIALETIVMKCNIKMLPHDDDSALPDYDPKNPNNFVCGLTWDERRSAFVDFTEEQIDEALKLCEPHKLCISCGMTRKRKQFKTPIFEMLDGEQDMHYLGLIFRKHDFVYLRGPDEPLYTIGQLLFIGDNSVVSVRIYDRYPVKKPYDEKKLLMKVTGKFNEKVLTIEANQIEGICYAKLESDFSSEDERVNWLSQEDHFVVDCYAKPSDEINRLGLINHELQLKHNNDLLGLNGPLRGLELFAGAGGFGTGLDISGFIKTLWAVEWDLSAAYSFRANHPETKVFCHSSNEFLAAAIGKTRLKSVDGKSHPLPQPGDVEIIFGGPPCQAFSGMNHFKDPNDPRVTLVCNMMSHVEFYRPKYFMLENVQAMLDYPLGATLSDRSLKGGIKKGVLKFILSSLTSLGYQVHFKVLQAGRYSLPQGRLRVIFLASKRGVALPNFPVPTHVFNGRANHKNMANGERLEPVSRMGDNAEEDHACLCAPFPAVVVDDLISDLPPFDWKNPCKIDPTSGAADEEKKRRKMGITVLDTTFFNYDVGFIRPEMYACSAMNIYQARVRGDAKQVSLHYTRRYREAVVEISVNVPLRPDANHSHIPAKLQNSDRRMGKRNPDQARHKDTYGRVDGRTHVGTLMTKPSPCSKIKALHPHQKRTLTVREYARLQGFPDSYHFLSDSQKSMESNEFFKQIGNAVPVPLSLALGRAIGDALLLAWDQAGQAKKREESPEL